MLMHEESIFNICNWMARCTPATVSKESGAPMSTEVLMWDYYMQKKKKGSCDLWGGSCDSTHLRTDLVAQYLSLNVLQNHG